MYKSLGIQKKTYILPLSPYGLIPTDELPALCVVQSAQHPQLGPEVCHPCGYRLLSEGPMIHFLLLILLHTKEPRLISYFGNHGCNRYIYITLSMIQEIN